jgi:hypothetical protein
MRDPLLPRDARLRARAAELHREWRADEEEWSRAALEHFRHGRSLVDVLRDAMHRGDVVVLGDDPGALRGVLVHVGDDWCRFDAVGGMVELPVTASSPVVRVVERSRHGGRSGDPDAPTRWRARLLELEVSAAVCVVELRTGEVLRGTVLVGGDHVVVVDDARQTYVPAEALLRLRPWPS